MVHSPFQVRMYAHVPLPVFTFSFLLFIRSSSNCLVCLLDCTLSEQVPCKMYCLVTTLRIHLWLVFALTVPPGTGQGEFSGGSNQLIYSPHCDLSQLLRTVPSGVLCARPKEIHNKYETSFLITKTMSIEYDLFNAMVEYHVHHLLERL